MRYFRVCVIVFLFGSAAVSYGSTSFQRHNNSQASLNQAQKKPEVPQKVIYCVDPDWLPYEAISDNVHVGMSADYLRLVAQYTDLSFELYPTSSWTETLEALAQGVCQFTPMLNKSISREKYLTFSDIYVRSPNVLVSLKEEPFLQGFENVGNRSLAIPKGYRSAEFVSRYYPSIRIITVDNEREGLIAVSNHQADLFIGSMFAVNTYIQQKGLFNLKIAGWGGPEDELRMAAAKGYEYLIPQVNKAIANISEEDVLRIYQQWNNINVIDGKKPIWIWWVLGSFVFVIIILLTRYKLISHYNRQLTLKNNELHRLKEELEHSNEELVFLSEHDPLTKLYNRRFFQKFISEQDATREQQEIDVSLVIIDVDYFKHINDKLGHSAGDLVLVELANVLIEALGEQDIAARWGGEEFVLLCQNKNLIQAKALCEQITVLLTLAKFTGGMVVTCSFGVAQLTKGETVMDCLDRADKALYRAKIMGRNQICLFSDVV